MATIYSISPNPASANENAGTLTFTVARSNSASAATVYASTVTDQGYANNGYYTGLNSQAVSFAAGQLQATVSVHINDLGLTSGSETFRFIVQQNASDPVSTYLATDNFTIVNNDAAPTTYSISPNQASVNENAGALTFTVTRSNSASAATVYASTVTDQGYANNGYYTGLNSQAVSFAAGQSQATVSVHINDLGLSSGSETFRFIVQQNASDPVSTYLATDNFTIVNNDVAPTTYSISPNPASVNENAGALTFTITRSSSASAATIYASTVQDQGYSDNGDYTGLNSQAVSFAAGQSQATVSVHINDLGLSSGSETFRFIVQQNASDPVSTYLATDNFTIVNNDAAPTTYSISPNQASVNENAGALTFTVTRSNSASAATVYASTVTDQGYANNGYYTGLNSQAVSFAAGQSQATVSVHINDLGLSSGSETFRFIVQQNASDPVSTYLATDNFTIVNNDTGTSSSGVDFSHYYSVPGASLSSKGYQFVINYLGPDSDGYLSRTKAKDYITNSIGVVSCFEVTERLDQSTGKWINYDPNIVGDVTYIENDLGYNNGYSDGEKAFNYAAGINQTSGSAIYFAIDGDATAGDINYVVQYFDGIQAAFSQLSTGALTYSVGVYGSGYVLDTILSDGLAKYKWLADAPSWQGSAGYTNYDIAQTLNGDSTTFPGETVDHDQTSKSNFGQWGASRVTSLVVV